MFLVSDLYDETELTFTTEGIKVNKNYGRDRENGNG